MLALMPMAGVAAPQQKADISKPTRERVKSTDKKTADKKNEKSSSTTKKDDKAATSKKDDKAATTKKDAVVATSKKDDKAATSKKDDKANTPKKDDKTTSTVKKDVKGAATPQKDEKAAMDQQSSAVKKENDPKSGQDTANKTAKPAPVKKVPVNTETAKFDGIDISKYQGTINWGELKNNTKIKFIYIKATEGSDYVDPRYNEHIRNAKRNGFKVGSYHFLSTSSSATTQFQNFIRTAKREDQDLIPVIDVERLKPWSAQQLRDSLMVFANLLEDYYGCKPLIYASEKFFTNYLGRAFAGYPLFIAKYSPNKPEINYKWILWQFSERGYFKAVKANDGLVDLSRFNEGCGMNDILYNPSKAKPKPSVKDAVDHKEKPATINATSEKNPKETPKTSSKQKAEDQKKAEKQKKVEENKKRQAQQEAEKKAKEKAEADKKAKQKAEHQKREKERQEAAQKAAEEKAKRKADAKKAREEKEKSKQNTTKTTSKTNKSTSMRGAMTQAQQGDSIRAAKQQGRKINKSSADND